jgi:hypothetical protein
MDPPCPSIVRSLYAWEIQEARRVFAAQLQYERIRVHECAAWPNAINRIGTRLKGMQYTGAPNAITLGNHCYFPVKLLGELVGGSDPQFYMICWLIHEMTHAWQFQHMGWRYLALALTTQLREGAQAYDFGGEQGLQSGVQQGWKLSHFNLEQQGDITSSYYARICRQQNVDAWQPYIDEIQGVA